MAPLRRPCPPGRQTPKPLSLLLPMAVRLGHATQERLRPSGCRKPAA